MSVILMGCLLAGLGGKEIGSEPIREGVDPTSITTKHLQLVRLCSKLDHEQAVLSTLSLANKLVQQGDEVVLFLDLESAPLGERTLQHLPVGIRDKVKKSLEAFVQRGGKMLVCPHCARRFDLKSDSLRIGATMTTSEELHILEDKAHRIFEYQEARLNLNLIPIHRCTRSVVLTVFKELVDAFFNESRRRGVFVLHGSRPDGCSFFRTCGR